MSKIRVSRDSGYVDRIRSYKIICDGRCIGNIGNGETKEFEISPGTREIHLKIDWCRSNKLRVDIPENAVVSLRGGSNMRGLRSLFAAVFVFLLPHKYLWLRAG